MPRNNLSDGKWKGDSKLFSRVRNLGKKWTESFMKGENIRTWQYDFGDGWVAEVEARAVDITEARRLNKRTDGFAGYDWMIDSILANNEIVFPKN